MSSCCSLLELAHTCVQRAVPPGGLVVDATTGNGNDTLFLAGLVGPTGLVLAFDIQAEAIENTRAALEKDNLAGRVKLFFKGHEHIAACLLNDATQISARRLAAALAAKFSHESDYSLASQASVNAAMFNLGFLPGSKKEVVTRPNTTLAALTGLLPAMLPGSVVSIHCYSGHKGGREESKAVLDWAVRQPERLWRVYRYETLNKKHRTENLILMERRSTLAR